MKKTQKIFVGLLASAFLASATNVWAKDYDGAGYILDSSGTPVLAKFDKCVTAPNQVKNSVFETCGDVMDDDGDGVNNDDDKCPNTPEGVKVDATGCPVDSDNDGVADYKDKCPNNTAEEISKGVNADGCPKDSDGDGIPDYKDDCPNEAGTPENNGCPIVSIGVVLTDKMVNFKFDQYSLTADGHHVVNAMVDFINHNKLKDILVTGHTDSYGAESYNQKLSEKRAQTIGDALRSNGVPAAKIVEKGAGELEPVQSNKTSSGRASNRRVEVKINTLGTGK